MLMRIATCWTIKCHTLYKKDQPVLLLNDIKCDMSFNLLETDTAVEIKKNKSV